MTIARQLSEIPFNKNSVVTVGSFDGVHLAHQAVLQEVVRRSRARGGRSVVVTFEPHPKQVLTQAGPPITLLSTIEERTRLCEEQEIDLLCVLEFTYEFSRVSFREFYQRYVIEGIGVSEVVEGYDHHFGRDREGNMQQLLAMGREFEFSVTAMKPVYVQNEIVGSTTIRSHLLEGNVERAATLLGRPYGIRGEVVRGDARGKSLGYPTANLRLPVESKLVPLNGIYFVSVAWGEMQYYGMMSIGVRPTFEPLGSRTLEVHILGFQGDLYGRMIDVQFLRRLREERKFDSVSDLIKQMDKDKEMSLSLVQEHAKLLTGLQQKNIGRS